MLSTLYLIAFSNLLSTLTPSLTKKKVQDVCCNTIIHIQGWDTTVSGKVSIFVIQKAVTYRKYKDVHVTGDNKWSMNQ